MAEVITNPIEQLSKFKGGRAIGFFALREVERLLIEARKGFEFNWDGLLNEPSIANDKIITREINRILKHFDLNDWKGLVNSRATTRAGCCKYRPRTIEVSEWLGDLNPINEVEGTILHELAHALSFVYFGRAGIGHGRIWKTIDIALGDDGGMYYDSTVISPKRQRRGATKGHLYKCASSLCIMAVTTKTQIDVTGRSCSMCGDKINYHGYQAGAQEKSSWESKYKKKRKPKVKTETVQKAFERTESGTVAAWGISQGAKLAISDKVANAKLTTETPEIHTLPPKVLKEVWKSDEYKEAIATDGTRYIVYLNLRNTLKYRKI